MTDIQAKQITLGVMYAKVKAAAQGATYRGLWDELLKAKLSKVEEVSNEKLDPNRH